MYVLSEHTGYNLVSADASGAFYEGAWENGMLSSELDRLLISCTRVQVWIRGAASATRGQLLWVRSAPQYVSAERAPYLRCSCARGWRDNLKTGLGMYLFSNGGTRPDQFLGQLKSLISFLPVYVSVFVLS